MMGKGDFDFFGEFLGIIPKTPMYIQKRISTFLNSKCSSGSVITLFEKRTKLSSFWTGKLTHHQLIQSQQKNLLLIFSQSESSAVEGI